MAQIHYIKGRFQIVRYIRDKLCFPNAGTFQGIDCRSGKDATDAKEQQHGTSPNNNKQYGRNGRPDDSDLFAL